MNRTNVGNHLIVPYTIEITDIFTPKSCSSFIAELIKYIAYNKEQIPYPYDRLKLYVLKRREREKLNKNHNSLESITSARVGFLLEKYYKKVEEAFEVLESTFQCIDQELKSCERWVEEVVVMFGPTAVSAKDVYRFQVPSLAHGHCNTQHLIKRQIGNLFRGIIISDEINTKLERRVGMTNMFVMLKMKKGANPESKWLQPKDYHRMSQRAQQVCFSFASSCVRPCSCVDTVMQGVADLRMTDEEPVKTSEADQEFVWFQTCKPLKGFREGRAEGKSITDLWYKYSFI